MPSRYRVTIEADTLPELIGSLLETASLMSDGDGARSMAAELAPLAEAVPLPLPPPDYQAAGLTAHQAALMPAPLPALPAGQPGRPLVRADWAVAPVCPIHRTEMDWKGAALARSGKQMPYWGCTDRNCREAIWPPR